MRLTNNQMFTRSMHDMSRTQNRLNDAHTRVTSLEKYKTSADAPADIAKSTYLSDEINKNTQYQKNGTMLKSTLGLEEATLNNLHTAMERGRVLSVRALNGTVGSEDLNAIAIEIKELQKEIFDLANTKNANGDHIFSGSASQLQPYNWDENSQTYIYRGNEQDNEIQIASNVYISSGDNGEKVFESAPARLIADTGSLTGQVSAASVRVIDQGEYDNFHADHYDFANPANNRFKVNVMPPTTPGNPDTFTITDSGGNVLQGGDFKSERPIRFDGLMVALTGKAPGSADISLIPPRNENIMDCLEGLRNILNDDSLTTEEFQSGIADAQVGIANAKYSVISVISSIGGRRNTIERVNQSNESFNGINKEARAILTEADLASAMTDLTREQSVLEISYQSFNKINDLSLFKSMR